jgi:GNAT superfamily N-acetyltransferase
MHVRQATLAEVDEVVSILVEAADWLAERGTPMWRDDELRPEAIAADVRGGLFCVAEIDGQLAGTIKFQLSDPEFWPDVPDGESAYVHRLAVRRRFAGGTVSSALLSWAADRAASLGRRYLRLDCEAARDRLRRVYERAGFSHHSNRQVGPYFVARYERDVREAPDAATAC